MHADTWNEETYWNICYNFYTKSYIIYPSFMKTAVMKYMIWKYTNNEFFFFFFFFFVNLYNVICTGLIGGVLPHIQYLSNTALHINETVYQTFAIPLINQVAICLSINMFLISWNNIYWDFFFSGSGIVWRKGVKPSRRKWRS